jgi:hypothetical protein
MPNPYVLLHRQVYLDLLCFDSIWANHYVRYPDRRLTVHDIRLRCSRLATGSDLSYSLSSGSTGRLQPAKLKIQTGRLHSGGEDTGRG